MPAEAFRCCVPVHKAGAHIWPCTCRNCTNCTRLQTVLKKARACRVLLTTCLLHIYSIDVLISSLHSLHNQMHYFGMLTVMTPLRACSGSAGLAASTCCSANVLRHLHDCCSLQICELCRTCAAGSDQVQQKQCASTAAMLDMQQCHAYQNPCTTCHQGRRTFIKIVTRDQGKSPGIMSRHMVAVFAQTLGFCGQHHTSSLFLTSEYGSSTECEQVHQNVDVPNGFARASYYERAGEFQRLNSVKPD